MVSKLTKVTNEMGFHMRPANVFVTAMTKYASNINIIVGDKKINGKSIMNIIHDILAFDPSMVFPTSITRSIITVECDGTDEQAMLDEAIALIESGFGE